MQMRIVQSIISLPFLVGALLAFLPHSSVVHGLEVDGGWCRNGNECVSGICDGLLEWYGNAGQCNSRGNGQDGGK